MKRNNLKNKQATGWEKIFIMDLSVKGLVSRIFKELQVNMKKINSKILKQKI